MQVPLLSLRINAGLTQAELAREVGVTQEAISQYEAGARSPRPKTRKLLADRFGIRADELACGRELRASAVREGASEEPVCLGKIGLAGSPRF